MEEQKAKRKRDEKAKRAQEYQELKRTNEDCQKKIILMDSNTRDHDKSTD